MSLLTQFEITEKEVYEVTQNEWLTIIQDHLINTCNRSIEEFNASSKTEIKCFHREQVERALKKGIEIAEIVLKDYPTLKSEVKAKQDKINSIPLLPVFTPDIYDTLQEGNKITVNGYKLTVYKKEEKSIIARIYRKQKQALELLIGERYNIIMGWS